MLTFAAFPKSVPAQDESEQNASDTEPKAADDQNSDDSKDDAASTKNVNAPAPPTDVKIADHPNDAGNKLDVSWTLSPDDKPDAKPRIVMAYEIQRKPAESGEFTAVGEVPFQKAVYTDTKDLKRSGEYIYRVVALGVDEDVRSEPSESTTAFSPVLQYIDKRRIWFAVILVVVAGAVVYFIEVARSGRDLKVRKIAGLEAVDEAVGRATEMGRSCLYVPGILDINDMQTIAGITVLSHVAKLTAEYDAELQVPTSRSLVMTTARETVEASYLQAGRPDAYREDSIYYLTDEQFGYVAGVTGTMVREKPAACFFMGAFFAESLILAETGNSIGAIQVAGTAMPSQLPFFVAACDYTLIGEEFFAASAYLSGEPHQLGSLKGQDVGKVVGAGFILVGCALFTIATIANLSGMTGLEETFTTMGEYLKDHILGEKGWRP